VFGFFPHFLEACRIPELIFWHIPSTAYVKVAPKANSEIKKPCVGSINKENVAPQAAEWGMMVALAKRPSVKVSQRLRSVISVSFHPINSQIQ
jgi:hypothetical protein